MADPREPGEAPPTQPMPPGAGRAAVDGELGSSQLGPAPQVVGADRLRAALRARMFGEDPSEARDEPPSESPDEPEQLGPAPQVVGAGRSSPAMAERPDPELAGSIGRFRVLDRLGSGGMGVVFSAYDPELDRKVAIKLLRPDVREGMEARDAQMRLLGDDSEARALHDAQARLLREAQAMARLSDPNVIVVHEVGSFDDGVFVAMEFIDGTTLGEWIEDRSRSWREVLEVFVKAGSGLAAAHRAGLVHRDFKPDNVLLGKEGQVRVLDFGLARSMSEPMRTPVGSRAPTRDSLELDPLGTPLTRTGAVMGTPAYMSPEQYLGHAADARSDQFSFCVALYEGLYGLRPFKGDSLAVLSTHVVEGRIRPTPADARVPKRLLAVLRRGLSPEPDDRYPSMQALLTELRRDPARKWRWGGLVLGVGALTSLATLAATGGGDVAGACAGLERELEGVWDAGARADVVAAIEGTGLAYAPRVASTTVHLLDDYTARWVSMAGDACGAALVARDDDPEHARRRQCLDQRLAEVGVLVDALRQPDAGMAEAAVTATVSLTSGLAACTDPRRLAAYALPSEPAVRQRLAQAHATLARAKAQGVLGHYEQALALATEVVREAQAADAGSLEARGLLLRGTYHERVDDPKQAEADLHEAVSLAERHGDPGTRAQALIMLIYLIAQDRTRYVEARMLGDQARAVLEYIDADPLLLADLDHSLGVAAHNDGDFASALAMHRRSHELRVKVLGADHPAIGRSLLNIGVAMMGSGREHYAQAERYLRQALRSQEQSLGPWHPSVGTALINLGNCLARQERYDEALAVQQRALQLLERVFGFEHRTTLKTVFNLARIMLEVGRHAEAADLFRRGLVARERQLAPDDVHLKGWVSHLGRAELELGHVEPARSLLERSLAMRAAQGEDALAMAQDRLRLARALEGAEPQRARRLAEQSHAALRAQVDKDGGRAKTSAGVLRWLDDADAWLAAHGTTTAGESGEGSPASPPHG